MAIADESAAAATSMVDADADDQTVRIVELYQLGFSGPKIAEQVGVSHPTVYKRLAVAGIQRRPAPPPRRYPEPKERPCAFCAEPYVPPRNRADSSRYCSRECCDVGRTTLAGVITRAELVELLVLRYHTEGLTLAETGRLTGGITAMNVRKHLLRAGYETRPASRRPWVRLVAGSWVECQCGCGRTRWVLDSQGYSFLGNRCWARWRWDHRHDDRANLAPLVSAAWPGGARSRFFGAATLMKKRNPGKKGEAEALEYGRRAVRISRDGISQPRALIEQLMREIDENAVELPNGVKRKSTDLTYRRVYAQVMRRLRRAAKLMPYASELNWVR